MRVGIHLVSRDDDDLDLCTCEINEDHDEEEGRQWPETSGRA